MIFIILETQLAAELEFVISKFALNFPVSSKAFSILSLMPTMGYQIQVISDTNEIVAMRSSQK